MTLRFPCPDTLPPARLWRLARTTLLGGWLSFCGVLPLLPGVTQETPRPEPPQLAPASQEGAEAIQQFSYPEDLNIELVAAEPDLANVVAFYRDYSGRVFVCETYRQSRGVEDNRGHSNWLDADLAAQTVQDRIDYIRKYIPDADQKYTRYDDRIRLLVDSDGDGRLDQSTVFADGFNDLEMGTGAGVLSYRGDVFYTCIPHLFRLRDRDGDGVADSRESLHEGFGVRFAFRGHDMHGLIVGPDGRLYFSIGDRGYNVNPGVKDPTSGAVFRCELDGSRLEVVATGLRNPQELAFDDFGNLFTGDNNSDSGDRARFTEILRGADSGWRMYYQYLPDRGPFNRERIWYPFHDRTPAYILPPIANISDGPSGLAFYPGTGFGDRFAGKFLLCDFRGGAANSGVRAFGHRPLGASWELTDADDRPFWQMLVTDVDFGTDGRLYVSDWVDGWEGVNKGRLYAFSDPQYVDSDPVREVAATLREGMSSRTPEQLQAWLSHTDRRIRQEAQFELVARGASQLLVATVSDREQPRLARVHALWGLAQLSRADDATAWAPEVSRVSDWLEDQDEQVVIATCRLVAESGQTEFNGQLHRQLRHPNLRVRFEAAQALAVTGGVESWLPVIALLADNADRDPVLRHGGIQALAGIWQRSLANESPGTVIPGLPQDSPAAVRRAWVIAMRKLVEHPLAADAVGDKAAQQLVERLADPDLSIVLEAVRALHDIPQPRHLEAIAGLMSDLDRVATSDPLLRRVLNANFRLGTADAAKRLARFAAQQRYSLERRLDVISWLSSWDRPSPRDAVTGVWRPLQNESRQRSEAQQAVATIFSQLMLAEESLVEAALKAAGDLELNSIADSLLTVVKSDRATSQARLAALVSLDRLNNPQLESVLDSLAARAGSLPPELAAGVAQSLRQRHPEMALAIVEQLLAGDSVAAQQSALATLGELAGEPAATVLKRSLGELQAGDFPAALRLDLLAACEGRTEVPIQEAVAAYREQLADQANLVDRYRDSLAGGQADRGRQIFYGKTEVSCVRCHQVGSNGGQVGPNLSDLGLRKDRKYILESIVDPNATIAVGYAQTKVLTVDGRLVVGLVVEDTPQQMVLVDADGKRITIPANDIEDTLPGQSSMPTNLHEQLTPFEIRDLVEFLQSQRQVILEGGHGR